MTNYTDTEVVAIELFAPCKSQFDVADLCPTIYAGDKARQRFEDLMKAFVSLDAVNLSNCPEAKQLHDQNFSLEHIQRAQESVRRMLRIYTVRCEYSSKKTSLLNLRLSEHEHEVFKKTLEVNGESASSVLRSAIKSYVDRARKLWPS